MNAPAVTTHFVVLKQEQIGALPANNGGEDIDAAISNAEKLTEADQEPRYVVQVLCQVKVDPKPRVVVTRFDQEKVA